MDHIETLTPETRFMNMVNQYQGFEFYQAFENDVDHIIGGKENTYWYIISKKGKATESYIATCQDGIWSDRLTKGKGS